MDGYAVGPYYRAGRLREIALYCRRDVEATAAALPETRKNAPPGPGRRAGSDRAGREIVVTLFRTRLAPPENSPRVPCTEPKQKNPPTQRASDRVRSALPRALRWGEEEQSGFVEVVNLGGRLRGHAAGAGARRLRRPGLLAARRPARLPGPRERRVPGRAPAAAHRPGFGARFERPPVALARRDPELLEPRGTELRSGLQPGLASTSRIRSKRTRGRVDLVEFPAAADEKVTGSRRSAPSAPGARSALSRAMMDTFLRGRRAVVGGVVEPVLKPVQTLLGQGQDQPPLVGRIGAVEPSRVGARQGNSR